MTLTETTYNHLSQLIHEKFGISLGKEKKALVSNRLQPLMKQLGFKCFEDYYRYVVTDASGQALLGLANQITTNYSFFYREIEHFNFLQNTALPSRVAQSPMINSSDIHIWSAGCSAGEEAYSTAIVLYDFFESFYESNNTKKWDLGVFATDLDTNMLQKANHGVYPIERLINVPPMVKLRHFTSEGNDEWKIHPSIRELVYFSRYNLTHSDFKFKGKFFIIFCRNVMIYFDHKATIELINKFYEVTEDQGYLIIGQTETLDKKMNPYQYVAPSIYQKK